VSRRKVVMAVVVALIFCAGFVWSADQDQSIDRIGQHLQTQDRLQDGSYIPDAATYEVETPVQIRDRLKDGTCDGEPDKEPLRTKEQRKDGSCQD